MSTPTTSAEKISAILARAQNIAPDVFAKGGDPTLAFALMAAHDGAGRILACLAVERERHDAPILSATLTHIVYESPDQQPVHWDVGGRDAVESHRRLFFAPRRPHPSFTSDQTLKRRASTSNAKQLQWVFIEKSNLGSFLKDWGATGIDQDMAATMLQDIPFGAGSGLASFLARVDAANGIGRCHSTMPYRSTFYRDIVTRFLAPEVGDWLTRHDARDQSPMAIAIEEHDVDAIKALLAGGFRVNCPDEDYCVALHTAAYNGSTEICRLLLEAGADPNLFHGGTSALHEAALYGHVDVCRTLIRHGARVEIIPTDPSPDYLTPLQKAIYEGEADYQVDDVVRAFGNEFGADLYSPTLNGRHLDDLATRPFMIAALEHARLARKTAEAILDALDTAPTSPPALHRNCDIRSL